MRALWPRLSAAQRKVVHDPSPVVGHRYPLTSGDVAKVTGLSKRQVQYWADHGLVPCWRKNNRRLFESVGLIVAFSLTNSKQHELQFYREMLGAPIEWLTAQLGILTSVLETRLHEGDPDEVRALAAALDQLTGKPSGLRQASAASAANTVSTSERHVIKDGDKWVVTKPGAKRASSVHGTQREAARHAAEILRNTGGGERVTHGRDGRIRSKDTIAPGN